MELIISETEGVERDIILGGKRSGTVEISSDHDLSDISPFTRDQETVIDIVSRRSSR